MSEEASLRDFVLGYCRQVGGLVEPPAYGIYEVLIPEEAARRWGVDPLQRFSFSLTPDASPPEQQAVHLYYGHPLVETIVAELSQRPADSRFFINPQRVEKPGLSELAKKLTFANAQISAGNTQRTRIYHYVCFNFKVSLVSDDKRELIVPVWMHLQGGYRLPPAEIQALALLDAESAFPNLDASPPAWLPPIKGEAILSPATLAPLLERSRLAVLDEMAPTLDAALQRTGRFLDLDRARLNNYYDDLQHDLEKRLARAEDERRPGLQAKLDALKLERQSKLLDAEQKYRLRADLELINLAIIAQPKIEIDVEISKRGVTARRSLAWDPLRHLLEPLVCDVCGEPGEGLTLCERGHLAHTACLAPQCLECKRAFCKLCAGEVHTCAVCEAPVCTHSLVRCKTCGRATCQKHPNLCHAADSEPLKESAAAPAPPSPPKSEAAKPEAGKPPKTEGSAGKGKAPPPAKKAARPASPPEKATAQRIQVEIENREPLVRAFALHKDREIALRGWELTEKGIEAHCRCEKGWTCRADNLVHRPQDALHIDAQVMALISSFAQEYGVPERKISFLREINGRIVDIRHLSLPAIWKDPARLAKAQEGFDRMPRRK
jgi:hypothetical protein